jgi:hypothetical protein
MRLLSIVPIVLAPAIAAAQPVELPQASPKSRTEQRVGVTDFSIDYSSPGVKGRKIWGALVAYDKPWRAGANAATKLTASRDFSFGGTPVKAGTYSVFVTPGKTQWTVMLNSDLGASQDSRDAAKDVAKVTVKPAALPAVRERLTYLFSDTTDDKVHLDLEWERVRIRVPMTVDTKAFAAANIDKATAVAWHPHFAGASYLHERGETDKALALVDKSISIQATWRNEWLRAQILAKQGNKAEAQAAAKRATALGKGDQGFEKYYKADVEKTVASWSK